MGDVVYIGKHRKGCKRGGWYAGCVSFRYPHGTDKPGDNYVVCHCAGPAGGWSCEAQMFIRTSAVVAAFADMDSPMAIEKGESGDG